MPDSLPTMVENFHFLRPWFLLALVPLALLAWQLLRQSSKAGLWESVCEPELLPYITDKASEKSSKLHWLFLPAAVLCIVALAGPTWEQLPTPVFRQESALVIILDMSRSMNAADVKPSRLERAKYKVSDILRLRKDGQTALIVFADQPFIVTPLTNDTKTIENQLPALTTDIMPSQGSDLLKAIEVGTELLSQAGIRGGDMLVLTDAANTDPGRIKGLLNHQGINISVLGIGTPEGAPVSNDRGGFLSDKSGNVILMTLDITGLRELANVGNGLYQTISADDRDVERFMRFIESASGAEAESTADLFADRWREMGPWLVVFCLPILPLAFRRGILVVLISASLSGMPTETLANNLFLTPDQMGQRAFAAEKFEEAKNQFQNKQWRAAAAYKSGDFETAVGALDNPVTADEWYNKANALARMGNFEEAIAAYEHALSETGSHEDAAHNKALLEELLEQQEQQENEGQGEDQQSDNDENQGGESQGEGEQSSEPPQDGGDSAQQSDEMSPEQDEQATQTAEEENEQDQQQEQAQQEPKEQEQGAQDGGAPNEQTADAEPMTEAEAEQEQATEQWLRQIPDDPGGLLRRKFEYEYQKRGAQAKLKGQQW